MAPLGTVQPAHITSSVLDRGEVSAVIRFEHLGAHCVRIPYQVEGPPDAQCTVAMGGISAGRTLGWWPGVAGAGCALDPQHRRLVGMDFLGGDPDTGPEGSVTTHDQARALVSLLDHLGVDHADLVGASYGGMVALAFAELFPDRVRRLVVLCAAHRSHPMATALRSVQRSLVRFGVESSQPARGLSLARALAMTTYRSAREFDERFSSEALAGEGGGASEGAPEVRFRFPVEEYLASRGAAFSDQFDSGRYLCLSESTDLHRTCQTRLPDSTLLVSVDSDTLVPPSLVGELASATGAAHATLSSPFGHDAFLKEVEVVSALLVRILDVEDPEVVR